jgi:hypothetical protein
MIDVVLLLALILPHLERHHQGQFYRWHQF